MSRSASEAPQPAPRSRARWYRRPGVWAALALPLLLLVGLAAGAFFVLVQSVPLPEDLDAPATVVLDVDGEEVGELQREANREDVELASLPDHVVDAVLAAEDASFYEHSGVSPAGIARAFWTNLRAGEVEQGGSTISQQYVKNFTGANERTVVRKVREAATAIKLEQQYSKDQILQLYLNSIYFGRGAYGIQAAARAYFDTDAADLTVAQAAQLAGVIPAPSAYDPRENPDAAHERYDYVIGRMVEEGWLDSAEAEQLRGDYPEVEAQQAAAAGEAAFYLAMVEQELARTIGEAQLYQGLEVRTHLDLGMQRAAQETYDDSFAQLAEDVEAQEPGATVPVGALVSLDPETGGIRALVGGPDYADDQFNLVTGGPEQTGRQPGSTFKPFALAAWVADGLSPESSFPAPAQISFTPEESGDPAGWEPSNYGGQAYGEATLREATWSSINTVYAQVGIEVGADAVVDVAQDAGIDRALEPVPSVVLGTQEVTPLELASAYNTIAAGGVLREPKTVVEVRRDGALVYQPPVEGQERLSEQVAWTVVDVLKGVIERGTGTAAQIGRPAFGKTGTTQDSGDAWFAGATPDLTTVVWMGNRDNREPMVGRPTGGGFPAQLWGAYMQRALEGVEPSDFPAPTGDLRIVGTPAPTPTAVATPEPEPTATATPEPEPTATPEPEPAETPDGGDGGDDGGGGAPPDGTPTTAPPPTEPAEGAGGGGAGGGGEASVDGDAAPDDG